MDRDIDQLADALVDWCGHDLEQLFGHPAGTVAQEMVKCLAFTLSNSQDARAALTRIVRNEMAEIRAQRKEYDR